MPDLTPSIYYALRRPLATMVPPGGPLVRLGPETSPKACPEKFGVWKDPEPGRSRVGCTGLH